MTLAVDTLLDRESRFVAFVAAHRARAVGIAWRLCGDPVLADELAQRAFVEAWRGLDRFRDEAALATWFHTILVRQVSRHQRWQRVRNAATAWMPRPIVQAPSGDPPLRERLQAAVDQLTEPQRQACLPPRRPAGPRWRRRR